MLDNWLNLHNTHLWIWNTVYCLNKIYWEMGMLQLWQCSCVALCSSLPVCLSMCCLSVGVGVVVSPSPPPSGVQSSCNYTPGLNQLIIRLSLLSRLSSRHQSAVNPPRLFHHSSPDCCFNLVNHCLCHHTRLLSGMLPTELAAAGNHDFQFMHVCRALEQGEQ